MEYDLLLDFHVYSPFEYDLEGETEFIEKFLEISNIKYLFELKTFHATLKDLKEYPAKFLEFSEGHNPKELVEALAKRVVFYMALSSGFYAFSNKNMDCSNKKTNNID